MSSSTTGRSSVRARRWPVVVGRVVKKGFAGAILRAGPDDCMAWVTA